MTAPTRHPNMTLLVAPVTSGRPANNKTSRLQVALKDLLRGRNELQIVHQDQVYVLRLTRNDKLILTK